MRSEEFRECDKYEEGKQGKFWNPEGFQNFYRLKILAPNKIAITKSARNIKNSTFAISAAPSAMPPKPKMAAMTAMTKNITDQRSIKF